MPEEQIRAALEQAEDFLEREGADETGEVVVWAENWNIVEVFARCQWQTCIAAGVAGGGRVWEGIAAPEVKAVCELLDVPRTEWRDILWGVGVMQRIAAPVLNEAQ